MQFCLLVWHYCVSSHLAEMVMISWNVLITGVASAPESETEVKVSIQMCSEGSFVPSPLPKNQTGPGNDAMVKLYPNVSLTC